LRKKKGQGTKGGEREKKKGEGDHLLSTGGGKKGKKKRPERKRGEVRD